MQLMIEIPDGVYDDFLKTQRLPSGLDFEYFVAHGTPLPRKHGRLIDADAIPKNAELKGFLMQDNMHLVTIDRVKAAIEEAPIILEADKE